MFDAKALRALDVSLILPIYSLGLVFTGVAAWLVLGEVPTPLGLAGVALIVGGVYLVELRSLSPRDALLPFRALFSNRAVWLLLPAFALYSVSSVLDKVGVLSSGSPVVYNVMNHCVGMALFTLVFWKRIFAHRGAIRANIGTFAALGTINVGFSLMSVFMYQTMDVLYVAALLQLSVLFNVVGGCVLFKEEGLARKLAAGTLIVAGSALLLA